MTQLEQALDALPQLSKADLAHRWTSLTAEPAPRLSADMLRLALAYELQARDLGGVPRSVQQRLDQLERGKTRTRPTEAGMRLVRVWNGRTHVVTIGEDQVIRWNEREWNSLSEVARAITGTRWSGPAFFGLKRKAAT